MNKRPVRVKDWHALRQALGLTQEDFGRFIGLGRRSIWLLEHGLQRSLSHNSELALRAFLKQPRCQILIEVAHLEHPFPEDVRPSQPTGTGTLSHILSYDSKADRIKE